MFLLSQNDENQSENGSKNSKIRLRARPPAEPQKKMLQTKKLKSKSWKTHGFFTFRLPILDGRVHEQVSSVLFFTVFFEGERHDLSKTGGFGRKMPPPGKPVTFYECHPEDHAPAPSVRADLITPNPFVQGLVKTPWLDGNSLSRRYAKFLMTGVFSKKEALTVFRKTRFRGSLGTIWHFQVDREHSVPIRARGSSFSGCCKRLHRTPNIPYTYLTDSLSIPCTWFMPYTYAFHFSYCTHRPTYSSYPTHTFDKHLPNSTQTFHKCCSY